MELRHLRYFAAVAELLSFRRAAKRLHVSQPTLTRQVQALEEEVGVRLLEREGRRPIMPTVAGRSLLADAQQILAIVGTIPERTQAAARGEDRRLNVATVAALSNTFLPECLRAFRKAFPQAEVHLFEMERAEQLQALREGRVQVTVFPYLGGALEPGLAAQTVLRCPMLAVLSDEHPAAKGRSADRRGLDIQALVKDVLVIPSPEHSPGYLERLQQISALTGFRPASLLPVEGGADNVLRMVAAGCGSAILPAVAVRTPVAMCVTRRLLAPVPRFELKLLWREQTRTDTLQQFLAVAGRYAGRKGKSTDAASIAKIPKRRK